MALEMGFTGVISSLKVEKNWTPTCVTGVFFFRPTRNGVPQTSRVPSTDSTVYTHPSTPNFTRVFRMFSAFFLVDPIYTQKKQPKSKPNTNQPTNQLTNQNLNQPKPKPTN